MSNTVTLKAYSSGTTEIKNAGLQNATNIMFDKTYPGGLCNSLSFYVPRNVVVSWPVNNPYRIAAYNGLTMVWEGWVTGITPTLAADSQGVRVTCEGSWSRYLMRQKTLKQWADKRIDESVLPYQLAAANRYPDYCTVDRNGFINFVPKAVAWANNNYEAVKYTAPTGQTIKRVTFDYDLAEGAQSWAMALTDASLTWAWSATTTTTGSADTTFGTPQASCYLCIVSQAAQTPAADGTIHAKYSNIVVYTETGSINAQEIAKDVRAAVSGISTDESKIGALTLSLVPFGANGAETYADILTRAVGFGDASYNRWACYVDLSTASSDGLPILVVEQVAALTSYDYSLRMDAPNVSSNLEFTQDFDAVKNWIAVQYQDVNGKTVFVTPDDDANLKDTTSIGAYGTRQEWLTVPTTDLTTAKNYARRYLAQYKDAQWTATGQISVTGYIAGASGASVPTSEIRPGKRVKIANWLNDLSGTGLTFLISGTSYDDDSQVCTMTIGKPDDIEILTARLQRLADKTV